MVTATPDWLFTRSCHFLLMTTVHQTHTTDRFFLICWYVVYLKYCKFCLCTTQIQMSGRRSRSAVEFWHCHHQIYFYFFLFFCSFFCPCFISYVQCFYLINSDHMACQKTLCSWIQVVAEGTGMHRVLFVFLFFVFSMTRELNLQPHSLTVDFLLHRTVQ